MKSKKLRSANFVWVCAVLATGLALPEAAGAQTKHALPASVAEAGAMNVGTSLQWPPYEYQDEAGNPAGFDIELVKLLAAELGIEAKITSVQFPAIIPGIQSGKFDLAVNELFDTVQRQKSVDMVDYLNVGLVVMTAGDPTTFSPDNLCGRSIAVTKGVAQVAVVERLSGECAAAGKPPLVLVEMPDASQTMLAVVSRRADLMFGDAAVAQYLEKTSGKLKAVPGIVPGTRGLVGIAVKKGNADMATALKAALEAIIANGSYKTLLEKYGLDDAGAESVTINGTK